MPVDSSGERRGRKLFSSGEIITLAGVVLCVMSAANTWSNIPSRTTAMAVSGAVFQRAGYLVTAFGIPVGPLSVGTIVSLAALAAGSLLLFQPTRRQSRPFFVGQIVAGLVIFGFAVRYMSLYAGVLMAVVGAACLVGGAAMRFGRQQPQ